MDLKRKRSILRVSIWVIGALVILGVLMERTWLTAAAVAVMVGWMVLTFFWWRCPHCGMGLGRLDRKTHCPYCGESIWGE